MKKTIIFGLVLLLAITSVMAAGSWNVVYNNTFEEGTPGNTYPCGYIMHGQPGCQDWLYSSQANDGIVGVDFSCYTDSMCALPVNIDFLNKDYKITFYAKDADNADFIGIGMSDYDGSGTVGYSGQYMWWSGIAAYSDVKVFEQSGLFETATYTFSSGVPKWGTGWVYHVVYVNSTCSTHEVYDTEGGTLLNSGACLNGPLPTQLNNKRLGLFLSQQSGQTSFWDDVTVSEWVPCTPDWSCNGYAACLTNNTQVCNSVTDLNTCGESYGGDYSEFTPQVCDYCTPSWSCSEYSEVCQSRQASCIAATDSNNCYAQTSLPSDQYGGTYNEFAKQDCVRENKDNNAGFITQQNTKRAESSKPANFFEAISQLIMNIRRALGLQ